MTGMNRWIRAFGYWMVLAAAGWSVAACGDGATEGARSRGTVEAVDAASRTVTLDHEEVPGLMAAMTMEFEVAPEVDLSGLAPGDTVEFRVEYAGGRYTVSEIRSDGS